VATNWRSSRRPVAAIVAATGRRDRLRRRSPRVSLHRRHDNELTVTGRFVPLSVRLLDVSPTRNGRFAPLTSKDTPISDGWFFLSLLVGYSCPWNFRLSKLTFHSDLRRRAASRRALPRTSSWFISCQPCSRDDVYSICSSSSSSWVILEWRVGAVGGLPLECQSVRARLWSERL